MKKILSLSAFLAIALFVSTACQTASTTGTTSSTADNTNKANKATNSAPKADEHGHEDNAERISVADAKKEFDAGNAFFLDTRGKSAYDTEHIKGAINFTALEVEPRYKELPTDKKIIAYCS